MLISAQKRTNLCQVGCGSNIVQQLEKQEIRRCKVKQESVVDFE